MKGRILVVDDDRRMCELLATELASEGYAVSIRTSSDEALAFFGRERVDAVVADVRMRGLDGISLCRLLTSRDPEVPVIVVTAFGSMETAIEAIRAGAYDFITKPFEVEALALALRRALEARALRREVSRLRHALVESKAPHGMIGESSAMQDLYALLARVADSDASVLLQGETGTGKELVAHALHRLGRRSDGPFVSVNCAAVPGSLLEAELFGHARGAFTDARTERIGLLEEADGGTVFLDEIAEMPLELQPKLLRVLEERRVRPLGAGIERPFDVRIIAATNQDVEVAVRDGRMRGDLLFRINVIEVHLAPLRLRGNDVLLLAQHFVERFAARDGKPVTGLSTGAAEKLLGYGWPGNVRELKNVIERAVALSSREWITVRDLPARVVAPPTIHRRLFEVDEALGLPPMAEIERRYIEHVLDTVGGNKALAARILGFDRRTLYRKLGLMEQRRS